MVTIVAAIQRQDNGIGKDGKLLFRLPSDMRRFRQLTAGAALIMGRKTQESIGRILEGRPHIVLSRDPAYAFPGAWIADSLHDACAGVAMLFPHLCIIGGGQVYRQALVFAERLCLTIADTSFAADTFFPDWRARFCTVVRSESGNENGIAWEYLELTR